ncbi:MAG: Cro/CI family transcriptional regulator [Glaciecola sp.]
MSPINKAINTFGDKGKYMKAAKAFDVTPQAIRKWERDNKIPAERVLKLEQITGIPRYELRPDIYPPEEYQKAS